MVRFVAVVPLHSPCALGVVVARELYDATLPLLVVSAEDYERLGNGQQVTISEDGRVEIQS